MGSVLASTRCHYCGARATTEDHIVPRSILPQPLFLLPYWFRQFFTTPACKPCNGYKSDYRSTCSCDQCTWVWNTALHLFIPSGYQIRGYRALPPPDDDPHYGLNHPDRAHQRPRPLSKNQRRRQQALQRRRQRQRQAESVESPSR